MAFIRLASFKNSDQTLSRVQLNSCCGQQLNAIKFEELKTLSISFLYTRRLPKQEIEQFTETAIYVALQWLFEKESQSCISRQALRMGAIYDYSKVTLELCSYLKAIAVNIDIEFLKDR